MDAKSEIKDKSKLAASFSSKTSSVSTRDREILYK